MDDDDFTPPPLSEADQRDADFQARVPVVFDVLYERTWDNAPAGMRAIAAGKVATALAAADAVDPARERLKVAQAKADAYDALVAELRSAQQAAYARVSHHRTPVAVLTNEAITGIVERTRPTS